MKILIVASSGNEYFLDITREYNISQETSQYTKVYGYLSINKIVSSIAALELSNKKQYVIIPSSKETIEKSIIDAKFQKSFEEKLNVQD